jgi:hypothetical protein
MMLRRILICGAPLPKLLSGELRVPLDGPISS